MSAHQALYPIVTMCRVLGVSPSGYYAWLSREPSARSKSDKELTAVIGKIHQWSRGTYGVPRMVVELDARGHQVNPKRVARLMREAGLQGVTRRKRTNTTRSDRDARVAPDLVQRDFAAEGPDELWVADATYIPTWMGFLYLAVVLDAWSRRIVGWAMASRLHTELMLEALNMALWQRRPEDVIHHSDQGCQYTSIAFGRRCREASVRPSMGSVGDCSTTTRSVRASSPPSIVSSSTEVASTPTPWLAARSSTTSRVGTTLIAVTRPSITNPR